MQAIMHQSFVTTAPTPYTHLREMVGKMTFQLSVPRYKPTTRGQTAGQNFAFCPALNNRVSLA